MNTNEVFSKIENLTHEYQEYSENGILLLHGDGLKVMKKIPDHSASLVLTDPPYHSTKKKNISGDTSFRTDEEYIAWMGLFAKEWK